MEQNQYFCCEYYLQNMEKQERKRKTSSGPIREKARTMDKLVKAVGKVIKKQGYAKLNIANISKEAGLDRKLVYAYFGSLDNLVETYIKGKDYWKSDTKNIISHLLETKKELESEDIISLLKGQFDAVLNDKSLQKLLHWELEGENKTLRKISDSRDELGEKLFELYEPKFSATNIDIRAILAIQIGGLYYLALHAKSNGSLFCGIDINQPEGQKRIEKSLETVINFCHQHTEI